MCCYLVVLLAIFSATSAHPVEDDCRHQVIIVGAGVSGFTAAATLLEHNVTDILVLEAADRIGGRVNTVEFGGIPVDKGAEFVMGEKGNPVYEMLQSYNLDLLASYGPFVEPEKTLYVNTSGHIFDTSYVGPLLSEAYGAFGDSESMLKVNGSVADFFFPRLKELLLSKNVDPHIGEGLTHLVPRLESANYATNNLEEMGARGIAQWTDCEGDQYLKWKREAGGMKKVFELISKNITNPADALPVSEKILLGKEVRRVEQKDGGVEVKCADGSTYLADHVIVTVSLGVLKKHAATMFHPPLPADKTKAIETMGFGCLGKIFLLFPRRWLPDNITLISPLITDAEAEHYKANSQHGNWTIDSIGFTPVMLNDRMMRVWTYGDVCFNLDSLSDDKVIDGQMELLNKLLGHKYDIPRPESILRTNWGSYPYTHGAYSFPSVESDRLNLSATDLAQPVLDSNNKPVILFAGEATNPHHFGSVHGALETGRREANNLISYLDNHKSL